MVHKLNNLEQSSSPQRIIDLTNQVNNEYDYDLIIQSIDRHNLTYPGFWQELPNFEYKVSTLITFYKQSKDLFLLKHQDLNENDFTLDSLGYFENMLREEGCKPYSEQDLNKMSNIRKFITYLHSSIDNPQTNTNNSLLISTIDRQTLNSIQDESKQLLEKAQLDSENLKQVDNPIKDLCYAEQWEIWDKEVDPKLLENKYFIINIKGKKWKRKEILAYLIEIAAKRGLFRNDKAIRETNNEPIAKNRKLVKKAFETYYNTSITKQFEPGFIKPEKLEYYEGVFKFILPESFKVKYITVFKDVSSKI